MNGLGPNIDPLSLRAVIRDHGMAVPADKAQINVPSLGPQANYTAARYCGYEASLGQNGKARLNIREVERMPDDYDLSSAERLKEFEALRKHQGILADISWSAVGLGQISVGRVSWLDTASAVTAVQYVTQKSFTKGRRVTTNQNLSLETMLLSGRPLGIEHVRYSEPSVLTMIRDGLFSQFGKL